MYTVSRLKTKKIMVNVPASKSIFNRALLLAAFTAGDTLLRCGPLCGDSITLLQCLSVLGIPAETVPEGILVHGTRNFRRNCTLEMGNAGTVARFLPTILTFLGGNYEFHASEQMGRRPMEILPLLAALGAEIEYTEKEGRFPFRIRSNGISAGRAEIGTDGGTQCASGLMLAATLGGQPFTLELRGGRTNGSYISMTAALIGIFGGGCERIAGSGAYKISPIGKAPKEFNIEPDVSGACYFYALSLLCNASVLVKGVHSDSLQGDLRFLKLLQSRGVHITDTENGILAKGGNVIGYTGFDEEMRDYSDQTMTVAVLAAFAESPSVLRGISHIRLQECDRVNAIMENLNALGVRASADKENIFIEPAPIRRCRIKTYGDHRIAMAFALAGLRIGGVEIDDPLCCSKTFPNYFELVENISE